MTDRFSHSRDDLQALVDNMLNYARQQGATGCEAEASAGFGQSVTVRKGEVETIEYNRDKGIGVSVYIGQRKGHASTSDFGMQALHDTVDKALTIARYTAEDSFAGLPDEALLARDIPDLDLYHPWAYSVEQAIDAARECEVAALAVDSRITNSEGASVNTQESLFVYGNSLGFLAGYPTSRHAISCAVIAESAAGMQRDYWYTTARDAADMDDVTTVGRRTGERTVRRLDARQVKTAQVPVLFEAPVAAGLIGHFVSAASGGSLYRKSSFLLDSLGKQIFSPIVQIAERPHISKGLASSPFDNEGVATQDRDLVRDGVLGGYFLSTYSARKLGMQSTGNAGGNHNLILSSTGEDFAALLEKMNTGLLVTELLGHGINMVTGDYSRGAAGFWVENGVIQYPVEEITIAGNLKDMFMQIIAIGTDVEARGSKQTGSILIERMTVAGE
ncbi:MAG: metalloprotease PmbA [Sulfuriferula sp.]